MCICIWERDYLKSSFENFRTNFVFVSERSFANPSFRFVGTYSKAGASEQWWSRPEHFCKTPSQHPPSSPRPPKCNLNRDKTRIFDLCHIGKIIPAASAGEGSPHLVAWSRLLQRSWDWVKVLIPLPHAAQCQCLLFLQRWWICRGGWSPSPPPPLNLFSSSRSASAVAPESYL